MKCFDPDGSSYEKWEKKEGKPMKKHADEIELVFFNEETCFSDDNREE